jgi:hypothetical protein
MVEGALFSKKFTDVVGLPPSLTDEAHYRALKEKIILLR